MSQKLATQKTKEISCYIGTHNNQGFWVVVTNARETYGHDDTLPFNCDMHFRYTDNNGNLAFPLIAKCYNDGWGGSSCLSAVNTAANTLMNIVDNYLKKNFQVHYVSPQHSLCWDVDLESVLDNLVWFALYSNKEEIIINDFQYYEPKRMANIHIDF